MSAKATNPKDALATTRLPLHLVPSTMKVYASLAFAEGAAKYGAHNWRVTGARASIYKSAIERHLEKWWDGEEADPVTGVPHLASVLAGVAIILDAGLVGRLTDDRPPSAPVSQVIDALEADVARVLALFADRSPRHYTIADSLPRPVTGAADVPAQND